MDFRQGSQEPNTETALYTIQFRKNNMDYKLVGW